MCLKINKIIFIYVDDIVIGEKKIKGLNATFVV